MGRYETPGSESLPNGVQPDRVSSTTDQTNFPQAQLADFLFRTWDTRPTAVQAGLDYLGDRSRVEIHDSVWKCRTIPWLTIVESRFYRIGIRKCISKTRAYPSVTNNPQSPKQVSLHHPTHTHNLGTTLRIPRTHAACWRCPVPTY